MPRLPQDAFERFVALGSSRSYARLAAALGVSKRSVTARAGREGWQQRLAGIETEARTRVDQKLAETTAAINDRHLRTLRAVQGKALQALTSAPMGTAAQAAATLIAAVRAERAIVAPDEAAGRGPTHAERLEAASQIPQEVVEAACHAYKQIGLREAAAALAATVAPGSAGQTLRVNEEN